MTNLETPEWSAIMAELAFDLGNFTGSGHFDSVSHWDAVSDSYWTT